MWLRGSGVNNNHRRPSGVGFAAGCVGYNFYRVSLCSNLPVVPSALDKGYVDVSVQNDNGIHLLDEKIST